jgi:hypothetical protein
MTQARETFLLRARHSKLRYSSGGKVIEALGWRVIASAFISFTYKHSIAPLYTEVVHASVIIAP